MPEPQGYQPPPTYQQSLAEGFQTQISTHTRDIGALTASVDRFVASATSAFASMKATFGSDREKGMAAEIQNATAPSSATGQTPPTVEGLRQRSINNMSSAFDIGRYGSQPSGGSNSGGGVPGGAAAAAAAAGAAASGMGGSGGASGGSGGAGGGSGPGGGFGGSGGGSWGSGGTTGDHEEDEWRRQQRKGGGTSLRSFVAGVIPYGLGNLAAKGVDEWHSQSAKNDDYRTIEGGTVANAMGERLREEKYAWNTMGVFSSDEASAAFKGVTRMGYTNRTDNRNVGASRHDALDYISQGKQSRGQSVEEGLSQVATASKSLNASLGSLQSGMEAVSESAGKAGVNTEMVRKQFQSLAEIGLSQGQGNGAFGSAQAMSTLNASMGKDFAAGVDSSQTYSQDNFYRMASMSNLLPAQVKSMQRNDPVAFAKVAAKLDRSAMVSSGITPQITEEIKGYIAEAGPDWNTPEKLKDIANKLQDAHANDSNFNPDIITATMSDLGNTNFGGNSELAMRKIVSLTGGDDVGTVATKEQMQMGKADITGKMADGTQNTKMGSLADFSKATELARPDDPGGLDSMGVIQSTAATGYIASVNKGGQRSGVVESLLKNKALQGEQGNAAHVLVHTKDGDKVVDLAEALAKFPNQVASGDVKFVDGPSRGETVQELAGGTDTTAETATAAEAEAGAEYTGKGIDKKPWENEHGLVDQEGPGAQSNERALIDLSPAAKAWFVQLTNTGDHVSPPAPGSGGTDRTASP